ncbi:ankyrin repeat and LEM domain-containing protein 2 homolog isoform X2 [Plutella xylostella]|uniref:ankyrin repeat and LEM domain-containing protein 2 homolog isoform X2 n=1 Tax=Plutella xylostella TaxID=51655 RepID=UPI002032A5CA|nr:ankyrin repeat and LEM domain-containing protein 2 homolog isoform X2 [Plutella xylostella]
MSKAVAIPGCNKEIGSLREDISLSPTDKKDGPISLFSRLLRLDSLGKKSNTSGSPTSAEPPQTYYGVYIPCEIKKGPDEETLHVYKSKSEAMELVRRYKLARFKVFQNHQDAVSFALRGADVENHDGHENSLVGEKPYPFKAPSPQDMVSLRKAIEAGLAGAVRDRVWDNPRYLVSSGSTPAILQEGSRYNALHVAAKAGNAEICNLILTTVGDPAFVARLYGADADSETCKEFAAILVDRYLNTPDKAMNETPLHFAVKHGAAAAAELLAGFAQCDVRASNKYGETPLDIVCKRAPNATADTAARIRSALRPQYYVPALHTADDTCAPRVGQPYTPTRPPELNVDPLSPRLEIRAFAGPMLPEQAADFRRKWKTPPRTHFRLKDTAKGLEGYGRKIAEEMKVGWKEYWPFLDTFTDLRTTEGLNLLENYLRQKYENACSLAFSESCAENNPDDLSLSRISLNLSQQSPPKDPNLSPMSELCVAMKTCAISNDRPAHWRKTDPVRQRLCRQPGKLAVLTNGDAVQATSHTVSQLLCIERTCQVFAKRIADALIFSLTAEPEVAGDSLKSEAKHLQHTMFTYMDDERFQHINFALIHSRLAQLVVFKLKQQTIELDDVNNLIGFLVKLRCPNDDIFSSDDERKPSPRGLGKVKVNNVIDSHVRCLSSFIAEELSETDISKGPSISETECTEIWDKASKCHCNWNIETFDRNSKKNASFRKNRSILSTSPKNESFIRRLNFENDIGDGRSQPPPPPPRPAPSSPAGDAVFTVHMDKCQVVDAEISDDESLHSACPSDASEYETASERAADDDDDDDDMQDASEQTVHDPFVYGEEPTQMDRLVYDAVADCHITPDQYPSIYRWRHTVALYPPKEREKWRPPPLDSSLPSSPVSVSLNLSTVSRRGRRAAPECSTPKREVARDTPTEVNLQVSNWLRVTGPNSPRCAAATKNVGHNVSFGY